MRKLRRLSKDFDENMKKATLRNFAARLRSMSKKESQVAFYSRNSSLSLWE